MNYFRFLKRTFQEFSSDKAGQMSAAFAYIAIFSIGPLLLVLVSLVGFISGAKAAQGQLYGHLSTAFGPQTAKTLQSAIANSHHAGRGTIALITGIAGLLLGSIGLTSQLQNSFDAILRAVPDPKVGIKRTAYIKLKNFIILGLAAAVLIASAVLSAVVNSAHLGFGAEALNSVVSLIIFIVILYLVYRFLPDVTIPRKIVWTAAAGISLLFLAGKIILGIVIGRNATASAYGAAAALVVILLWFYYIAQILLLGMEGVKVYGDKSGVEYRPKSYTLKRRSININIRRDIRGRLLEAFVRSYKANKK